MESIEDHTHGIPIILAGCFCLITGLVLMIWSMSGYLMLGGSMLFGVIADVLGYQRQSVVLIIVPLLVGTAILFYFESELLTMMKPLNEEIYKFEKTLPKISVPGSNKFD